MQPLFGLGAQPGYHADRQGREEVSLSAWRDEDESVGLARAARDLRDQLRGRSTDGGCELDLGVDLELDPPRDLLGSGRPMARAGGDVEVRLVEGDALDQLRRGEAAKDLVDKSAGVAIAGAVGIDHHELRTERHRLVNRLRRMNAKGPRLVRGAHHHRPPRPPGYRHREAPQPGVVTLVDGGVEGVKVDVEDGARPVFEARHRMRRECATRAWGLLTSSAAPLGSP